jgi:hypothetical protein
MRAIDIVIKGARKGYRLFANKEFLPPLCNIDRKEVNYQIYNLLSQNRPSMISRFGTVELNCINNYLCVQNKNKIRGAVEFITDNTHTPWWNTDHFKYLELNAGVFPASIETSEEFSRIYLEDIPLIDVLGSFQYYEKYMPLSDKVYKAQLETLYPFFVENPWTKILEGLNVLVVHPFEDTIKKQYLNRDKLFNNIDILPSFNLLTFKAVQSSANNQTNFKNWFEALEFMKNKIEGIDFDIALLGCGAYGLPLAAHVKRLGKKSVHLGGGLQLLFGIKGKRWESQYKDSWEYRPGMSISTNYNKLFNDYWTRPSEDERPEKLEKIENGCYW